MGTNISEDRKDQKNYELSSPYSIRFFKRDLEFMKRRGYNVTEFTRWVIRDRLSHTGGKTYNNNIISREGSRKHEKGHFARNFGLQRIFDSCPKASTLKEIEQADEFSEMVTYLI